MVNMKKQQTDIIQCPVCNCVQKAKVEFIWPWPAYVHECRRCRYVIMESEWNIFKFKPKYILVSICNFFFLLFGAIGIIALCILSSLEIAFTLKARKITNLLISLTTEVFDDIKSVNFFTDYYLLNF